LVEPAGPGLAISRFAGAERASRGGVDCSPWLRHSPLGVDERVGGWFRNLTDCPNGRFVTESQKRTEDDLVSQRGAARLLGAFGQKLGYRPPQLDAVSWSVKALTQADEPRDPGPRKLTKVEVAGKMPFRLDPFEADPRGQP
jgi:hypothetical protein